MSKPSNLVSNLNEIMEEYAEKEEEAVQATQAKIEEEERAEEARAEHGEEKESDWVSQLAYVAWRDKLQHRDFIGERGFNKWIFPFQEIIEKRGWLLFCEHKALSFVDVVKEFYVNMVGMKDKTIYIIGKWISFNRERIDQTYNLNERNNGSKFKKLVKEPNFHKIIDLLTYGKGKWNTTRKNPHESIARGSLIEQAKVWFYFISSVIFPTKHLSTVREKEAVLLYAILKGYKFNVRKIIENSIFSYYRG